VAATDGAEDVDAWIPGGAAAEGGAENPEDLAERLVILHEGASVAYSLGMAEDAAQQARQIAVTDLK
jgi:hypothetical protein